MSENIVKTEVCDLCRKEIKSVNSLRYGNYGILKLCKQCYIKMSKSIEEESAR